jgi:Na+/H+ antiporter NhaC
MEQDFNEQQKLPNAVIALVLAILSIIGCCFYGLPGLILAIIALVLANMDRKKYRENPEMYTNYGLVKTARIISIIALVLSAIVIAIIVGTLAYYGFDLESMREAIKEFTEKYEQQQQLNQ